MTLSIRDIKFLVIYTGNAVWLEDKHNAEIIGIALAGIHGADRDITEVEFFKIMNLGIRT